MFCTPIADAGFLLDFPLVYFAQHYETTILTRLLFEILSMPYPYRSVIFLSGLGTFLSIQIAYELMDVMHHRDREFFHSHAFQHEIIMIVFFLLLLVGYYELIASLGVEFES